MDIKLSISLLASDRVHTLERCLDSLKSLLTNVPSELIIVFTGQNKETGEKVLQIAEQYAGMVIPFAWCDDFSKARNAGLNQAKGEWFMFLDDDEWFENTHAIEQFFLSGEYRQYESACYQIRNYQSWNGLLFKEQTAQRMVRRREWVKFKYPIHETLSPLLDPCKYLDSYIHHYGYMKVGVEENKSERNIPLLLEDIQAHPDSIKNYRQLVQEYVNVGSYEKAKLYCLKALELTKKREGKEWLYYFLGKILVELPDKEKGIVKLESILQEENLGNVTHMTLLQSLIQLYVSVGNPQMVVQHGLEFEDIFAEMEATPTSWREQMPPDMNEDDVKEKQKLNAIRMYYIYGALSLGEFSTAQRFLGLLPWSQEEQMQTFYASFELWNEEFSPHFKELIFTLEEDSPWISYFTAKNSEEQADKVQYATHSMEKTDDLFLQQKLVKLALEEDISLVPLTKTMDVDAWIVCVQATLSEMSIKQLEQVQENLDTYLAEESVYKMWVFTTILEEKLKKSFVTGRELMEELSAYCDNMVQFCEKIYQKDLLEKEGRTMLSKNLQAMFFIKDALQCTKEGDLPQAVKLYGKAIKKYAGLTAVMREAIRYCAGHCGSPQIVQGGELDTLATQMKQSVYALMEEYRYTEAYDLITQLLPILPEDLELLRLKQQVLRKAF